MTAIRRKLIAGNWKMNGLKESGTSLAQNVVSLVKESNAPCDFLVCPPFSLLDSVGAILSGSLVALGGQDCHITEKGAHTGDISAQMLADLGCQFVIVGHSERRANHKEDDSLVRAKAQAAISAGLTAVICIGETEEEREHGRTIEVNSRQARDSMPDGASACNVVIAYEPVWAIGTGRTPTICDVQETHAAIRRVIAEVLQEDEAQVMRILYGGSMNPSNASELLALADVDGGLIGGASLDAQSFIAIAESCSGV